MAGYGKADQNDTVALFYGDGSVQCYVPLQKARMDSIITCIIFQLPFYMEAFHSGYISGALSLIIIITSIFIKKSYKYFIIYQGIWDLIASYDFICDKPSNRWFEWVDVDVRKKWGQGPSNCFYYAPLGVTYERLIHSVAKISIQSGPFSSLLLLGLSRVLAMYFPILYKRFVTSFKICFFIIGYTLFNILILSSTMVYLQLNAVIKAKECEKLVCANGIFDENCNINNINTCLYKDFNFFKTITFVQSQTIESCFTAVFVVLTIIFTILTVVKVITQLRLQKKLKQKLSFSSLKIAIILSIQCFTIIFIFIDPYLYSLSQLLSYFLNKTLINFPPWFQVMTPSSLTILRSILDSIIILIILTEYRQTIWSFGQWLLSWLPFKPHIFISHNSTLFQKTRTRHTSLH